MTEQSIAADVSLAVKKFRNKRGNLIMILHEIQNKLGFVPREAALLLSEELHVPLAKIYEVITFYHYFKLEAPGRVVISVCTGTACYLKGAPALVNEFEKELGIKVGESTPDKSFHVQCVRCVGCCGLAPVVTANGKTYGKLQPVDVKRVIHEWRQNIVEEDSAAVPAEAH